MKIRSSTEAFGIGVVYHKATRTILFALFGYALTFAFPRPGDCKHCGHGAKMHAAARSYGFLEWSCHGDKATCECDHYEPVILQAARISR